MKSEGRVDSSHLKDLWRTSRQETDSEIGNYENLEGHRISGFTFGKCKMQIYHNVSFSGWGATVRCWFLLYALQTFAIDKLQPVVRLACKALNGNWRNLKSQDVSSDVSMLGSAMPLRGTFVLCGWTARHRIKWVRSSLWSAWLRFFKQSSTELHRAPEPTLLSLLSLLCFVPYPSS